MLTDENEIILFFALVQHLIFYNTKGVHVDNYWKIYATKTISNKQMISTRKKNGERERKS